MTTTEKLPKQKEITGYNSKTQTDKNIAWFLHYASQHDVSSSTDLNHKCSIEEPNLFLFFF
jgi:hypothetical protein